MFYEQIAAGGPVTVTDPEVRRYVMTISEAVGLVLAVAYTLLDNWVGAAPPGDVAASPPPNVA